MSTRTLAVIVEDKPGALARISGLFSRRGYNISSLAVGPTEEAGVSRMTICVSVDEFPLEQVTKQLNKLVNVIKIVELEPTTSVQRELVMLKVRADATVRSQVLEVTQMFRAKVVDVAPDAVTVEATGTADKLSALRRMLEPYGIREIVQSGIVALARSSPALPSHLGNERPSDSAVTADRESTSTLEPADDRELRTARQTQPLTSLKWVTTARGLS